MPARHHETIVLDYGDAGAARQLLKSLSTVVAAGEFLWSAADEVRTVECLRRVDDDRYRLHRQVLLDDVFPDLPGEDEVDIESIDIAADRLWICSSHCRVRRKSKDDEPPHPEIRLRASQCLFGAVDLKSNGGALAKMGETLPFKGDGSLRNLIASDEYLMPFLNLPSKENGVDIEGMVVFGDRILFGLRGPVIGGSAVVVEVLVRDGLQIDNRAFHLHFLDLEGLGVRDLAHAGDSLLVLAGPVNSAEGPFRIYPWTPIRIDRVQQPGKPILADWMQDGERPEGVCQLERNGQSGILILYDNPDLQKRIEDNCYVADWFRLPD